MEKRFVATNVCVKLRDVKKCFKFKVGSLTSVRVFFEESNGTKNVSRTFCIYKTSRYNFK